MDEHAVHPIEGDLLAFVDGAASPQAEAHIRACTECLAEARALAGMAALFGAALDRDACPEPDALLEYSMGFAGRAHGETIRQHVAGCERCTAELAELNAVDSGTQQPTPQLWGPIGLAAPTAGPRRLLARPLTTPARSAMRGEERRQLVFQAGDFQLVLSLLVPGVAEQGWRVEGQVSSSASGEPGMLGATVSLLAGETQAASDAVDDLGYFALDAVPGGDYTLELSTGDETIAIDELLLQ